MIKPESNAPASMQPWVRTTDKQLERLEAVVERIDSTLNANSTSVDQTQNQSLANTFTFTPTADGGTVANSSGMNFTGPLTAEGSVSVAGSIVVGNPARQELDPVTGNPIGTLPNFRVNSGSYQVNPVTQAEYYTSGNLKVVDTFLDVNAYGAINGDGLAITLSNEGQTERANIQILGVTGDGTTAVYQIANNPSNVATYTAGKYVNITGVIPSVYNGSNMIITSVNTSVSPMTFSIASAATGAYTSGGYVTINQSNSIYEGKLSVRGPAPDYTGVTVEQDGVYLGASGGDPALATTYMDLNGFTGPNVTVDQAVIGGTRLFISSTAPTAVNDGDIWIDKSATPALTSLNLQNAGDNIYISNNPGGSLGPGNGVILAPQMVFATADSATSSSSSLISAFPSANDVLSNLEPNKIYRVRGKYFINFSFSVNAGNVNIKYAFSAAPSSMKYSFKSYAQTPATNTTRVGTATIDTFPVLFNLSSSAAYVVEVDGYFITNATSYSTFTPQFNCTATPGTFANIQTGSWLELEKIGNASQSLIAGNWA